MRSPLLALLLCSCGTGSPVPVVELSPTIPDAEIEYVFRPGHIHAGLGAWIDVNRWHQRSPERDEVDVLVLGDSVVAAGNVAEGLNATALLEQCTGLRVANISCDSWGPGNLLAYVRRYGTFGATRAFLVTHASDAGDVPWEAVHPVAVRPEAVAALVDLLALLRGAGLTVTVLLHHYRAGAYSEWAMGNGAILGAEPGLVRLAFDEPCFADEVHLSEAGNVGLAAQILAVL